MAKTKYFIDTDLGIDWQDAGQWRSYQLTAEGDTLKQVYASATVSEIDQDGGELSCYGIEDASNEVFSAASKIIVSRCIGNSITKSRHA